MKGDVLPVEIKHSSPLKSIQVAVVCAFAEQTGPGRQLAAVASRLAGEGIFVRVAVLDRKGRENPPFRTYLESLGVEAVSIPDRGPLDVGVVARTRALMETWRPDIVQSHGYKATAVAFALRRSGFDRPWIGFYHGATHESRRAGLYHRLDRWMLARATRVVVMSNEQLRLFRGLPSARVIYNAVTPDTAGPSGPALPGGRPRIGVIGRLSPEKGVDVFLHAARLLANSDAEFHAIIVGDGPERSRLETVAHELGVEDRVTFIGHVEGVADIYPQLDLVVIPSRSEGLPNVLLEALASGRRVVSTAVGAVPDVLVDDNAGTLVPVEDPVALSDAITRFLGDNSSESSIRAACQRVLQPFSLETRIEQHVRIYGEIVGSQRSGEKR